MSSEEENTNSIMSCFEESAEAVAYHTGLSLEQVVDHSHDEAAETKGLELKNQGNQELIQGHFLKAIRLYSEALEYSPKNAIILANRAQAYIKVENYGLAIVDATHAIQLDPHYAKGYYRRASAYFALNKYKLARKDFRKVVTLKPKDRDARSKLAECEKAIKEEAFMMAIVSEATAPLSSTYNVDALVIDANYNGPRLLTTTTTMGLPTDFDKQHSDDQALFQPGKLPLDFVMACVQRFKDQKTIHKRYVARLLIAAKHYFESLPSLMEISIPNEGPNANTSPRVTVCGDTHGQFYDLLHIFDLNGFPSTNNPYLFNGDFVDRGSFSVEVILTLLLFKLTCPDGIYLTRGNHETKNMNKIYGFEGEVKAKYDDKMFVLFLEVFSHLPLAATIENVIFVTHGGIPPTPTTLEEIRTVKRNYDNPPESGLMSDLLWSDPQPFAGKSPSKRGVGFSFGPDITQAFLEQNNLQLLVRSHEVKEEGYLVEHGGKTITVFSAPNYCDTMGNKGAFIHFDASLEPKFTQFSAVPHPEVRPMAYAAGMGGLF